VYARGYTKTSGYTVKGDKNVTPVLYIDKITRGIVFVEECTTNAAVDGECVQSYTFSFDIASVLAINSHMAN
jgi:hypothetical protein